MTQQLDRRRVSGIWIGAFLVFFLTLPGAEGQDSTASATTPPAARQPTETGAPLPHIIVTAKAQKKSLGVFVSKVTGAPVTSDDHPMARWRSPVCPLVAGLPQIEGKAVFDRFT